MDWIESYTWLLPYIVIPIVFTFLLYQLYNHRRCDSCDKWNALEPTGKVSKGESDEPGRREFRCKYCFHVQWLTTSSDHVVGGGRGGGGFMGGDPGMGGMGGDGGGGGNGGG